MRLGLIVPSSNTALEMEIKIMAPNDISIHWARTPLTIATLDSMKKAEESAEESAEMLSHADVDLICYGCTSASIFGWRHEKLLIRKIENVSGKPTVTADTSVIQALKELNAKSISIVTPYIEEVNLGEKAFFAENGFKVKNVNGMGIPDNLLVGRKDPKIAYNLVKKIDSNDVDTILISCTNLNSVKHIEELEKDLGKPIISSNSAILWAMLKKIKYDNPVNGFGRLLASL